MAKFNFNLKQADADHETHVLLIVRYSNQKVVYYTRETIHPDFWDSTNQRAKQTRQFPDNGTFNMRLDRIMYTAKDIFRQYQNDHGHEEPSVGEYKTLLDEAIKGTKKAVPVDLFGFTEHFIEEVRKKQSIIKKTSSRGDIAKSYNQTLSCLKDFAKDRNCRVDFDVMDMNFYADFVEYLETVKKVENGKGKEVKHYGFTKNTVGKHIKNLKRILNEAASPEKAVNKFTFYKRFMVLKEEVDSIYLNESELKDLYTIDLSNNPRLDRVRDLFLVSCWTGLRFSDVTNIQRRDIKADTISITTQKTGQRVTIPIFPMVRAIMEKYKDRENSLPPQISNPNMNLYLKELGAKIKSLETKVEVTKTRAGKRIITKSEKFNLLTTHTARRSFATNMYKAGMPTISIMAVTGHRTEKAFLTYIKMDPDEHAKVLMNYAGANVPMVVVK